MRFLLTVAFCFLPLTVFAEVVEIVSDETPKQEVVEEEVADATPVADEAVIPPRCSTNCATLSRVACEAIKAPVKLVKRVVCHTRTRIRGCSLFRRPLRRCCR